MTKIEYYKEMQKKAVDAREKAKAASDKMYAMLNADDGVKRTTEWKTNLHKIVKDEERFRADADYAELVEKFARENASYDCFDEMLPVVSDVLNKYIGKKIGEKTRKKIADEVEQRCPGVRCYVGINEFSASLRYCFTFGENGNVKWNSIYLNMDGTVLNGINDNNRSNPFRHYTDVPAAIDIYLEQKKELKELADRYNELVKTITYKVPEDVDPGIKATYISVY